MSLVDFAASEAFFEEGPDGFVVFGAEGEVAAAPFGASELFDELVSGSGDGISGGCVECDGFGAAEVFGEHAKLGGVIPIHPVAEPDGLFGLPCGEAENAAFAFIDEAVDAVFADGGFGAESELFFDFDFDPESLAVEAVLVAEFVAGHGVEPLIGVFIGASPCVVDTHGIIGGDGSVEEAPARFGGVLATEFLEGLAGIPEVEDVVFAGYEVAVDDWFEH